MAAPTNILEVSWSTEKEDQLVELWAERPCLFDISIPEYSNRVLKMKALTEIALALEMSVDQIKKRLKSLRTQYTKARKPPTSGSARKSNSRKITWLLEKLNFLSAHIGVRTTMSNLEEPPSPSANHSMSSDDDDEESTELHSTNTVEDRDYDTFNDSVEDAEDTVESTPKSTKRPLSNKSNPKSKKKKTNEIDILKDLAKTLSEPEPQKMSYDQDDCFPFCMEICQSLKKMDERTKNIVKHKIHNIIFQAQMGDIQEQQYSRQLSSQNQGTYTELLNNTCMQWESQPNNRPANLNPRPDPSIYSDSNGKFSF